MRRFLLLFMMLGAVMLAAQGGFLTLQEARELALQNNAAYQAKLAEYQAAEWGKVSALGNFLPSLSLDGSWLYMDPAATVTAGTASITLNNDFRTLGLSLSQPLFLGGKLWQGYQISKLTAGMAQTELTGQRLTLLNEVDRLYLGVLQTKDLLALSDLDLRSATRNLELAQLKLDNGLISSADYLRFQSRLASKEVAALQSRTALQLAQLNLRNTLGIDFMPEVDDLPGLEQDASLQALYDYDFQNTEALTALALEKGKTGNTTLQLLDSGVELSRRAYQIRKGSFLPTLMLVGSRQYEENGIDRYKFSPSTQVILSASLPLLPQVGNYAELKKAEFNYQKARLEVQTASNGIQLGTEAAVLSMVSAAQQLRAARLALDYTQTSYEQLQERFRLNLISSTEMLDADLMLSSARIALDGAVYGYHKARLALMEIMGLESAPELDAMIITGANK